MNAETLNFYLRYFSVWAGLPENTLTAIAIKESSYNPTTGGFRNVCNFVNACGLMQLRPIALKDIREKYGYTLDPLNPIQAIVAAALLFRINRDYIRRLTGTSPDIYALVAAYNGGYGSGIKYLRGQVLAGETRGYVSAFYNNIRAIKVTRT